MIQISPYSPYLQELQLAAAEFSYATPPPSSAPRHPQRSKIKRAKYGGYGYTVFGWPSVDGVIIRSNCDLVELRYLGFDPLNVPASRYEGQDKEDAFCAALRKIGGKWWRSEQRWLDVKLNNWTPDSEPSEAEMREIYIGWPGDGGVLVLDKNENNMSDDVGMLRMVTSMEERCRLMRDRLEAVYYENPRDHPGFAALGPGKID